MAYQHHTAAWVDQHFSAQGAGHSIQHLPPLVPGLVPINGGGVPFAYHLHHQQWMPLPPPLGPYAAQHVCHPPVPMRLPVHSVPVQAPQPPPRPRPQPASPNSPGRPHPRHHFQNGPVPRHQQRNGSTTAAPHRCAPHPYGQHTGGGRGQRNGRHGPASNVHGGGSAGRGHRHQRPRDAAADAPASGTHAPAPQPGAHFPAAQAPGALAAPATQSPDPIASAEQTSAPMDLHAVQSLVQSRDAPAAQAERPQGCVEGPVLGAMGAREAPATSFPPPVKVVRAQSQGRPAAGQVDSQPVQATSSPGAVEAQAVQSQDARAAFQPTSVAAAARVIANGTEPAARQPPAVAAAQAAAPPSKPTGQPRPTGVPRAHRQTAQRDGLSVAVQHSQGMQPAAVPPPREHGTPRHRSDTAPGARADRSPEAPRSPVVAHPRAPGLAVAHTKGAAHQGGSESATAPCPRAPRQLLTEPVHDVMRFHKAVTALFRPFACQADCAGVAAGRKGKIAEGGGAGGRDNGASTPEVDLVDARTVFASGRPGAVDPHHLNRASHGEGATEATSAHVPPPPHPAVPENLRSVVRARQAGDAGPTLADVWQAFNTVSAQGLEVPCLGTGLGETLAFFTPHLSAMQITAAPGTHAACPTPTQAVTLRSQTASQSVVDSVGDADSDAPASPHTPSMRSTCAQSLASAGLMSAPSSPACGTGDGVVAAPEGLSVRCSRSDVADDLADLPIVLRPDSPVTGAKSQRSEALRLAANWATGMPMWERPPLLQHLWRLALSPPSAALPRPAALFSLPLRHVHPSSWFAVAWHPTYRIPEAPLTAKFITYHTFADFAAARVLGAPTAGLRLEAFTMDIADEDEAGRWLCASSPAEDGSGSCMVEDAGVRRMMKDMMMRARALSRARVAVETRDRELLPLKFVHADFENVFTEARSNRDAKASGRSAKHGPRSEARECV